MRRGWSTCCARRATGHDPACHPLRGPMDVPAVPPLHPCCFTAAHIFRGGDIFVNLCFCPVILCSGCCQGRCGRRRQAATATRCLVRVETSAMKCI